MTARSRVLARGFTVAAALGFAVAAAVPIQKAFTGLDFLRSYRWPLYASEAAILLLIALMFFLGAMVHIAGLAAGCAMVIAIMAAKFDSESSLAPLIGISAGVLAFIYVKAGWGSIRLLPPVRVLMLGAAVILAMLAIARMEEPPISLDWQRVRSSNGAIEVRKFPSEGACVPGPPVARDLIFIDSGCSESIPRRRAYFVLSYSTVAAGLALAALSGSPQVRRLPDGTEVPTWI